MDIEIKTWLYDILQCISEIESYYENKAKIFEEYLKDIKTKSPVSSSRFIAVAINRIENN